MSTTIIARFQPRPGAADSVERILRGMIAPTRGEPGCQRYDLYRTGSVEAAGYCLIERCADEAAVRRDVAELGAHEAVGLAVGKSTTDVF